MANIVLNTSNVTEIKYVHNGTTTSITELKYKKGSGTTTSVWSKPAISTQAVTCTHSVVDNGESYILSMTFTRQTTTAATSVSVSVVADGTALFSSNTEQYLDSAIISWSSSSLTATKTITLSKSNIHSSGYKIRYNDPIASAVSYSGNFPLEIEWAYDYECPYLDQCAFKWVTNSGVESTQVTTAVYGANNYDFYVTLAYYLKNSDETLTFLKNSELNYVGSGMCNNISTILDTWYGGKNIVIKIASISCADDNNIFLPNILELDEQYYYEYICTSWTCVTSQSLLTPSVTLEWVYDYDDMGDGTMRDNNTLYIDITNNNTTYGTVNFKATTYLGTADDNYELTTKLYAYLGPGESKRLLTRVLDYTSGQVLLEYSKVGFTSGSVTATFGNWAGGGGNTNTNTA